MDRQYIVEISRRHHSRTLGMEHVINIVTMYIIDRGRTADEANAFVMTVLSNPLQYGTTIMDCFTTALQHYEKKFSINKLLSKDNQVLLIF